MAGDLDAIRSTAQASTAAEQTLELSVELPTDVVLGDASVIAKQILTMNDRVQVPLASATNRLGLIVGLDAKVGDLRGARIVTLKDRAKVSGDVKAGLNVSRGPGSTISGTVTQNAAPTLKTVSWSAKSPEASLGDVTLNAETRRLLSPNTYGNLTVRSRAKLTLETGVYVFQNVLIEAGAEVRIHTDYGPVQLFAKGSFTYRGSIVSTGLDTPQFIVGYLGTTTALVEAPFLGALIAPNADVRFQAALPKGHQAFIHGKSITLDADTKIAPYLVNWLSLGGPSQYTPPPANTPVYSWPTNPVDIRVDVTGRESGSGGGGASGVGGSDAGGGGGTGTGSSTGTGAASGSGGGSTNTGGAASTGGSDTGGVELPPANPVTVTKTLTSPISFDFPPNYPVAGGILANGTVSLTFQNGNANPVTCTFRGGSSSAFPVTQLEINKGRTLNFVGCSDGLGVNTRRTATSFSMTVNPVPGFPVSIEPPLIRHGGCGEIWEEMTPEETYTRSSGFNWANATRVAERDNQNRPTLYYARIYVRNNDDLLALKKLRIHKLSRPLLPSELAVYDDRCGAFRNTGDGTGVFVNALIPGTTYNKLIDAFTTTEVEGNREIFRAVILRTDLPSEIRTQQGSVSLQALADAGFRYLYYEADPLRPINEITLDAAVVDLFVDVLTWVGNAAQDVVSAIGQGIADLDKGIRGRYPVTLDMLSGNPGVGFAATDVLRRGWGPEHGFPIGANGMQVTALQWTAFLPSETIGRTDMRGRVSMDLIAGAGLRNGGNGICLEYTSEGAKIVDFLTDSSKCDFRALLPSGTSVPGATVIGSNFGLDPPARLELRIEDTRLNNLYQLDDGYQFTRSVFNVRVDKRVQVLGGAWAATFTATNGGAAFTTCGTYPNSFQEMIHGLVGVGGGVATQVLTLIAGPLGGAVGAMAEMIAAASATILTTQDIILPENDSTIGSRNVGTHEYGHFLFCTLMYARNNAAVDHVIWSTVAHGSVSDPIRYINEGFADFFTGQVTGGANYPWITQRSTSGATVIAGVEGGYGGYCRERLGPAALPLCFEANLDGIGMNNDFVYELGTEQIGRVATLLFDVFDGNPEAAVRANLVPNNADPWTLMNPSTGAGPLIPAPAPYVATDPHSDSNIERVALPGLALIEFAGNLADGLQSKLQPEFNGGPQIDDEKLYKALSDTMEARGLNWCERCRVFSLHDYKYGNVPSISIRDRLQSCIAYDDELGDPPRHPVWLDAETCQPCPDGKAADANGVCQDIVCPVDVVIDASTLGPGTTSSFPLLQNEAQPFDPCPETFIVRVDNFSAFGAAISTTTARLVPWIPTHESCGELYEMEMRRTLAGVTDVSSYSGSASFVNCTNDPSCESRCVNVPSFTPATGTADTLEFKTHVTFNELGFPVERIFQFIVPEVWN